MRVDDIVKIIKKVVNPLNLKISLSISRGKILSSDDSGKIQLIQASFLAGENKDKIEKMHHFGFSSNPPENSDAVMVCISGNRDHGIIIATENREFRFKDLGKGEVALYSKDGDHVHLKNGNVIDIKTKTLNIIAETEINITSPQVTISDNLSVGGNQEITGNLDVTGDVSAANIAASESISAPSISAATSLQVASQELNTYETHTHNYTDGGNPAITGVPNV